MVMKTCGRLPVRFVVALALGFLLLAGGERCASASELSGKIGFVDVEEVFEKYQKTKDLNSRLDQVLKEKISERKAIIEEINKLKDEADILRDEAKKKKEVLVDEKVKKLYQFEEKVKREAVKRRAQLQEEILVEIRQVLTELGEKEEYAAIFPFMVDDLGYHADRLNITEKVIKLLNDKYRK